MGAMYENMRLFMFALCVGHAASLTLAAGRPNLAAARVHRSALRMQEEIPSKFVRSQWGPAVSVTLPKPLGLKLVEGSAGVVRVEGIVPEGSACRCPQIKAGMSLVSAAGQECSSMGLESVMGLIGSADASIDLVLTAAAVDPSAVERAEAAAAAPAPAPQRVKLEGREKVDASFEKNFGSEEGFAKLVTKVQKTVFNWNTWKNPLWGGSLAFAVGFPLIIVVLAGDRL